MNEHLPNPEKICATVSDLGLTLNGVTFDREAYLIDFAGVIGAPSRTVVPEPPAPWGHRNNEIHVFDSLGFYVIEDHATRRIGAFVFVFDLADSHFPPDRVFCGQLVVNGYALEPNMREADLPEGFTRSLPGDYHWKNELCSVHVGMMGRRGRNRRRSRTRYLVNASVCFAR